MFTKNSMKTGIYLHLFIILLFAASCSESNGNSGNPANPYGLDIVNTMDRYNQQIAQDPAFELVDLEKVISNIDLDIRYATTNNFTKQIIYTEPKAFVRKPVAAALVKVQDSLAHHNLGLRIYDAYRPYAASLKFYEVYPDTNFVANPKYGSRHNRGCAVDVTLIDLTTGKEIAMPSDFDDFSAKAHPDYKELTQEAAQNRTMLFNIMSHFGLTHYPTEWWHFDYQGWEKFPLMDIKFDELEK